MNNNKLLTEEEIMQYNKLHYDLIQRYQEGERELGGKIKGIQDLLKKDEYNKMSERDKIAHDASENLGKFIKKLDQLHDTMKKNNDDFYEKAKKPAAKKRNRSIFKMEL